MRLYTQVIWITYENEKSLGLQECLYACSVYVWIDVSMFGGMHRSMTVWRLQGRTSVFANWNIQPRNL